MTTQQKYQLGLFVFLGLICTFNFVTATAPSSRSLNIVLMIFCIIGVFFTIRSKK